MTRLAAVILVVIAAAACGRSSAIEIVPPPPVPFELVPVALDGGKLALVQNTDKKTEQAFAGGGKKILIGDGKLWEIRDGQRLIGTLQIATVKSKVDLTEKKTRDTMVRQLMPGAVNRLDVEDITVYATSSNDKVVYMWFGKRLFQVVQLKGGALEPDRLLSELIQFQLGTGKGADLLLRGDLDQDEDEDRER